MLRSLCKILGRAIFACSKPTNVSERLQIWLCRWSLPEFEAQKKEMTIIISFLELLTRFELVTSSLPWMRATDCAIGAKFTTALAVDSYYYKYFYINVNT